MVEGIDGVVDGGFECVGIGEGLMREVICLEVVPDALDIVQLWGIFGQPLDAEPVSPCVQRRQGKLAGMDRPIVLDQHHRLGGLPGLGTIEPVQLLEMRDEVRAALGRAGMHDEPACDVIA